MKPFRTYFLYTILISSLLAGCSTITYQTHETRGESDVTQKYRQKEAIPLEFFPRTVDIVALGDSLTKGVGSTSELGGYLPYLEETLIQSGQFIGVNWHNYGIRGHRTDQLIQKLEEKEIIEEIIAADVIIITIGGNDIMKVIRSNFSNLELNNFIQALPDYEKNVEYILDRVRTINNDATVYFVGVYNPLSRLLPQIQEFNSITSLWNATSQKHISQMENMFFVDISTIFLEGMNVLYEEDLFHPNELGYEKIADAIHEKMVESNKMNTWGTPMVHASRD